MSFELNEEMLSILAEEFAQEELAEKYIQVKDDSVFVAYGESLARRTLALGEQYPDRTYAVMKAAVQETGAHRFPLIPQRFVEIAILATQGIYSVPIIENTSRRLAYRVKNCKLFQALKERGTQLDVLPCKSACVTFLEVLHRNLGIEVDLDLEATSTKEGYCQFVIEKK